MMVQSVRFFSSVGGVDETRCHPALTPTCTATADRELHGFTPRFWCELISTHNSGLVGRLKFTMGPDYHLPNYENAHQSVSFDPGSDYL